MSCFLSLGTSSASTGGGGGIMQHVGEVIDEAWYLEKL